MLRLDPESKGVQILERLVDLMIAQVLFIVACIPVITAGAALTALFSLCRKLQQETVTSVVKTYFRDFKGTFRQSTAAWLLLLLAAGLLYLDIRYYAEQTVPRSIAYTLSVAVYMEALYLFPLMAWFDNKLLIHLRNAPLLAVRHILTTILVTVLYGCVFLLSRLLFPLFIFFGFSGSIYLATFLFAKVFRKHGAPPANKANAGDA
ncbi:MAG: YesL family protein [Christensenellales bacterium]|jgi:uncharacterized membrane protein YesL